MPTETITANDALHFDDTTDFIVVGLGAAGASAALEARAAGLDVLVLERGSAAAVRARCAVASSIWAAARACRN